METYQQKFSFAFPFDLIFGFQGNSRKRELIEFDQSSLTYLNVNMMAANHSLEQSQKRNVMSLVLI